MGKATGQYTNWNVPGVIGGGLVPSVQTTWAINVADKAARHKKKESDKRSAVLNGLNGAFFTGLEVGFPLFFTVAG